jgi:serine/threonine protein phosphatase PrpC
MTRWKSFGASVCGPGHIATGAPNQDAWASFHHVWGDGIVVSDGVGSAPLSNFGSDAACHAVERAAEACRDKAEMAGGSLFDDIKARWLSRIHPLEPRACAATCLFAFRLGDGEVRLGMLGDGLAAVVKSDGSVAALSEDKSQGFSNVTIALSPRVSSQDWRHLSLPEDKCDAILLCTDGVADDLDDVDGFVLGFVEEHRRLAVVGANRRVRAMLENWPTPRHSDDKTIVCLCREEAADE